jgi:hypothetical protein
MRSETERAPERRSTAIVLSEPTVLVHVRLPLLDHNKGFRCGRS